MSRRRPRPPGDVEVTRPDKLLWPDLGITKRDYVDYLGAVTDLALPWLRGRPLTLVRAPDGVGGKRYFQKAISDNLTKAGVSGVTVVVSNGAATLSGKVPKANWPKAMQAANLPQPTISEFKVHKLDWCG